MQHDDLITRIAQRNDRLRRSGLRVLAFSANPARLDLYDERHPLLPLRKMRTQDGGTSYRQSITLFRFTRGDRTPASLEGSGGGTIDARW